MMGDQKFDGGAVGGRCIQAQENGSSDLDGFLNVIAAGTFPDVMKEQGETQNGGIVDFRPEIGKAAIGDRSQRIEGNQCVLVDRVVVIEIADNQTIDALPF